MTKTGTSPSLERRDRSFPVPCAAVEVGGSRSRRRQTGLHPGEEAGERAGHQCPVAFGHHLGESSSRRSNLAEPTASCSASMSPGSRLSWRRDGERLEDLESVALHVADQAEDLLALLLELGLVDAHAACAQLDVDGLLHLGAARSAPRPWCVGASGRDRRRSVSSRSGARPLSIGLRYTSEKRRGRGRARGHDRQGDHRSIRLFSIGVPVMASLVVASEATDALVGLRRVVLDELRLVEDQHLPVDAAVLVELQTERGVGRHDDPGVAHRLGQRGCRVPPRSPGW